MIVWIFICVSKVENNLYLYIFNTKYWKSNKSCFKYIICKMLDFLKVSVTIIKGINNVRA